MSDDAGAARTDRSWGAGAVLLAYLMLAVGFICIGVSAQTENIVWGLWITEVFAIALPALIWLRATGAPLLPQLGLRWPRARWLWIAAGTAILNQPVVSLLTWIAQEGLPRALLQEFEQKNASLEFIFTQHPLSMLAAVALSAPLGEEIFFRGFALPAAARSMRPLFAALLTAALFSLMHADAIGALGLFEIGLWLAALRWGSGSLVPAMLGHALNNGLAGVWFLLGLQSTGRAPPAWAITLGIDNPDAPPPTWVMIAGALLVLLGVYFLRQIFSRPSPADEEDASARAPHAGFLRALPLTSVWLLAAAAGAFELLHLKR